MTRNRLLILIGVLLVLLLGLAVLIFALLLPQSAQSSVATATVTPTGTLNGPTSRSRRIVGVIKSLGDQSFVISPLHNSKIVNVTVSAKTKYASLDGKATFTDLKVGQNVEVRGHVDPQDATTLVALNVLITPPTGKISNINGQTLLLAAKVGGQPVTVHTSSATVLSVGEIPVSASFLTVGEVIGYEGTAANDGSINATHLYLIVQHIRGTVSAINAQALTLQLASGSTQTVTLTNATTYARRENGSGGAATPTIVNAQALKVGSKVDVSVGTLNKGSNAQAVLILLP